MFLGDIKYLKEIILNKESLSLREENFRLLNVSLESKLGHLTL